MTLQPRSYLHPHLPQAPTLEASYGKAPATDVAVLMSNDSQHLLSAWQRWRSASADKTAMLPHRRDMDLVSIARLMPRLVLLDVFSPQRMIFRLAGTDIESVAGMRLTGRDHILLARPDQRAARSRLLWGAATHPCGALAIHILTHPKTGKLHQIETFVLPILPDESAGSSAAPIQLIGLAAGLPVLDAGSHVTWPLEYAGATQHFLDLGAGIPA